MKDQAVARLVLVSSYSVYDWTAVSGRLTEASPIAEHPYQRDGYTVAKVWQEKISREASEELGFDLVVLRPGFIWSREKWDVAGLGIRVGRYLLVVGPRARPPMTHVRNCAEAVSLAVVSPSAEGRTFNVVDAPARTSWTWAKLLAPPEARQIRVPVPYLMATVLVRAVALASRIAFPAGGRLPSIFVPRRFDARFKPLVHSAELLRETLEWAPRGQPEGHRTFQDESPRDRRLDPRRGL
jgi:UDP-glucose 4-epimerase